MNRDKIKTKIKTYSNFPKEGINFLDISELLLEPDLFREIIEEFAEFVNNAKADIIVAPEARGFIFGTTTALFTNTGFAMVRKPNKLPGDVYTEGYLSEYSTDALEIKKDIDLKNKNVVIIDDVYATGGTSRAIKKLIEKAGANLVGECYLIEINIPDRIPMYKNHKTILKY